MFYILKSYIHFLKKPRWRFQALLFKKSYPSLPPKYRSVDAHAHFIWNNNDFISPFSHSIFTHRFIPVTPSILQQSPFSSASRYQTYYDAKRKEHPQALCLNGTLRNWVKWWGLELSCPLPIVGAYLPISDPFTEAFPEFS